MPVASQERSSVEPELETKCRHAFAIAYWLACRWLAADAAEDVAVVVSAKVWNTLADAGKAAENSYDIPAVVESLTREAVLEHVRALRSRPGRMQNNVSSKGKENRRHHESSATHRMQWCDAALQRTLLALPKDHRNDWFAVFECGLTYKQAAQARGVSIETIREGVHAAAQKFSVAIGRFRSEMGPSRSNILDAVNASEAQDEHA